MMWVAMVASGLFGGLASILLRLAALQTVSTLPSFTPLLLRSAAIGSYGIGFVLYALALRKATLGTAYPLMVAVSILVVLAFTALYEHVLKPTQAIGALVILIGVWLVTRHGG